MLVASIYAVFSAVWIIVSDTVLLHYSTSLDQYRHLQTYKGSVFILASSALIFFLLYGVFRRACRLYDEVVDSKHHLQMALSSSAGGVWEIDFTAKRIKLDFLAKPLAELMDLPLRGEIDLERFWEMIHPDDADSVRFALDRAATGQTDQFYEKRYRVRARDGSWRWIQSRGRRMDAFGGGRCVFVGVTFDVTERVASEVRIDELLLYDPLTGLSKAQKFLDDGNQRLRSLDPGWTMGVFEIRLSDVDMFTGATGNVNEDGPLLRFAERVKALMAGGFLVSRLAAGVFALASPPMVSAAALEELMSVVFERLREPITYDGDRPVFAVGAARAPGDGSDMTLLARRAAQAVDARDTETRGEVRWFTPGLDTRLQRRHDLERQLRQAVERGEIVCHYQPLVDLRTGRAAGFEALARWRLKSGELVQPAEFIALAEEIGEIGAIGAEVLRQACVAAAAWEREPNPPFIAVNVSPIQLSDSLFPALVARVLAETGLTPERLELEITENAVTMDVASVGRRLAALRAVGISIAIDDFGTGYSSLAILSGLPFTRLKIDRAFVTADSRNHANKAIINTIVDLSRRLGLSVTAEGVETEAELALVMSKAVDLGQGYYFSRPVPRDAADLLLARVWSTEVDVDSSSEERFRA